ncbi:hypothetical protein MJO29_003898 [Puccinia striiformis f. sp. tritici]|nr:hypothetical protein MJO29_003898 [Puccinia striiformis f. sp. tritici]
MVIFLLNHGCTPIEVSIHNKTMLQRVTCLIKLSVLLLTLLPRNWQSLSTQPNRPGNGRNKSARLLRSHLSVSSSLAWPALTVELFGDKLRVPVMPVFLSRLMCSIAQPGLVGCWTLNAVHVMSPYPGQKSVFVMDNARMHHGRRVCEIYEANQVGLIYLSPYLPGFDPIKKVFSVLKICLKRA